MTLMDGKRPDPLEVLDKTQFSHVRQWGILDLDKGEAFIRAECRRCGMGGQFISRQEADVFITHHRGANGLCPHESEVIY